MKRFLICLALLLFMATSVQAQTPTPPSVDGVLYKIYESGKPVTPKYVVRRMADGSLGIYPSGKPVLPRYVVRGGKVYEPGKPVLPVLDID